MAELDTSGGGKKDGGKVRTKKKSTRVDLTAMVDLAFLLITFFILTTTLQKPKAMDLTMPDKDEHNDTRLPVPATRTMTVLLGANNKVEWFIGVPGNSITPPTVTGFGKKGIRESLLDYGKKILETSGKPMIVLVSPSDHSTYYDMVTMMDELNIVGNEQRAIVDISKDEVDLLKRDNVY